MRDAKRTLLGPYDRSCPNPRLFLGSTGRQSGVGYGAQHHTFVPWEEMTRSRSNRDLPPKSCPPRSREVLKARREDLGVASRASPGPFPPVRRTGFPGLPSAALRPQTVTQAARNLPRALHHPHHFRSRSWGAHPGKPARCLGSRPPRPICPPPRGTQPRSPGPHSTALTSRRPRTTGTLACSQLPSDSPRSLRPRAPLSEPAQTSTTGNPS